MVDIQIYKEQIILCINSICLCINNRYACAQSIYFVHRTYILCTNSICLCINNRYACAQSIYFVHRTYILCTNNIRLVMDQHQPDYLSAREFFSTFFPPSLFCCPLDLSVLSTHRPNRLTEKGKKNKREILKRKKNKGSCTIRPRTIVKAVAVDAGRVENDLL